MLHIERDSDGAITAIHQAQTNNTTEQKTLMDEEIIAFLGKDGVLDTWVQLLSISDVSIIRVLEDLIEVLVKKNIIMLTDLPEEARNKLKERKKVRNKIESDSFIVDNII